MWKKEPLGQQAPSTQRHNYQQQQRTQQPQHNNYQQPRQAGYRQQCQNSNTWRPQQNNDRRNQYNNYNTQANIQEQQPGIVGFQGNTNGENINAEVSYTQEQQIPEERYRFDQSTYQLSVSGVDSEVPKLDVLVSGTTIRMVIDTGAVVNMINIDTYNNLINKPPLEPCTRKFYAYGETRAIGIVGQFFAELSYRNEKFIAAFLVAPSGKLNL